MKNKLAWGIAVFLSLAFAAAAIAKFTSQPFIVEEFQIFGYPTAFMMFTGVLEVVAAALVLVPRFSALGAGLISCIMIGALSSHLTHGQVTHAPPVVVLLALALTLGWLRSSLLPFGKAQPAST